MRIVDPLADPRWDERLVDLNQATVFHTAAWARVLADSYGYPCCYLAMVRGDRLAFLMPLMDVRSHLTGKRGISLPFTDFCEPLLAVGTPPPEVLGPLLALGRQRGWQYWEAHGGQGTFSSAPTAMTVLDHALDLTLPEASLLARIREGTQRNIRKARRERVEVSVGTSPEMLEEFYRLNCLTRREHGLPPQPAFFFRSLQRHLLEKRRGCVALATRQRQSVAGAVFLHYGHDALYKYGASDPRCLAFRPNDLVMWTSIQWHRSHGFHQLSFGRTELHQTGLRRYKLAWGVRERERHYYRCEVKTGQFVSAQLRGPKLSSAVFKRLPIRISRFLGTALYRHVA